MKYNISKPISPFISVIDNREVFIDIDDRILPGVYPYYMVSNFGRVYHKFTRRFLSPGQETGGYLFVYLSTYNGAKKFALHRLVMISFYPVLDYQNLQVNHINGDKTCNVYDNLEWCTCSENQKHAYRTGLHPVLSSITEEQVYQICDLLVSNKYMIKEISEITGVSEHIVADIKKKHTWREITKNYNFESRPGKLFTDNDLILLCEYFQNNLKSCNISINDFCRETLQNCGFDSSDRYVDSIRKLYSRKNFNHISKDYEY